MQYKHILDITAVSAALAKENLGQGALTISVRLGDDFLITDPAKKADEIREEDIVKIAAGKDAEGITLLHRAIYAARKDINAVITYASPYSVAASETLSSLPAVLDDMAQIVGPAARTAADYSHAAVIKAMRKRGGCLVKGQGAVLAGRTLDEAHTAVLALEKNAKSYIDASVLGGAIRINYLEALLMQFVYKKKYSKADQTAKMEDAGL